MKKLALLSVVVLGLSFVSCEKDDLIYDEEYEEQLIDKDEIETASDDK